MSEQIRVAAVQFSAADDPEENLRTVIAGLEGAAGAGARLVVFPEAAMAGFQVELSEIAEPLDGRFASGVRRAADRLGVVAVVGMFTPAPDGRVRNTLLITGPGVETAYDKIHLYDAFGSRESDTVAPGEGLVTFEAFGTRVGVATCYDVRFADQFSALGRAGAKIVCVPASWGEGPGKAEQWDLLVRARAMDAQAWMIACGMAWTTPRGAVPLGVGRSAVVDPLGVVRARLSSGPDLLVANVDLTMVDSVRERVPLLR